MKHHVLCGVDRADALSDYVSGKKIALLTAASGVNRYGVPTYAVIRAAGGDLRILFSPEHGLYSALQDGKFGDEDGSLHPGTGARLYSLGAKGHPALAELVGEVDLAVYDIQDVGARFYTYLCVPAARQGNPFWCWIVPTRSGAGRRDFCWMRAGFPLLWASTRFLPAMV